MSHLTTPALPPPHLTGGLSVNACSLLLTVNGAALALTGFMQATFDLSGYFFNKGPLGPSLHGNLDTLAFVETHGLAVLIGLLLIIHRNAPGAFWHRIAAATHVLLGTANLMFWGAFERYDLVPMGIVATAMHIFFAATQLTAAALRTIDQGDRT